MRTTVILFVGLIISALSFASIQTPNPAKPFSKIVREADGVVIEYWSKEGTRLAIFEDALWRERLSRILENTTYKPQSHCFCISYPEIRLVSNEKDLLRLSIHHGGKLRGYSDDLNGDFLVGAEVCDAIMALVKEKPPMDTKPKPPKITVPPPVVFEKNDPAAPSR